MPRLAVICSHPIQYYAPLFRELAKSVDLHVYFAHKATPQQQADAGFGVGFEWDSDLVSGYSNSFLENVAADPGVHHFAGCDTPGVAAKLAAGGFGAVLVMGWHLKTYLQAIWAARRRGLPILVRGDSHLATPRHPLKRLTKELLYPAFLRQFAAALYVGQRSRAYYEAYRYPPFRLFFSPHSVDTLWFATRASHAERVRQRAQIGVSPVTRVVLLAGRLVPFKRPLDLVEACAILRSRRADIHLLVAGDGELRGEIEERCRQRGVPLTMLGFRNQSQMPAAYAAGDVLVLPSDASETWGLVVNEAIACGRPVLVSDGCGCALDIRASEGVGLTFRAGDVTDLADGLSRILQGSPDAEACARFSTAYGLAASAAGVQRALEFCLRGKC